MGQDILYEHLWKIGAFVGNSLVHIWPYLVLTIPMSVAIRLSNIAPYITAAFQSKPLLSIFLATAVGALSPFCSCGVIPIVAAMLIGGVPLAPVMSFWIASPSMDPEIFFLSVATIGWDMAIWRLIATFVISLGAGFITYLLVQIGWIGPHILKMTLSCTEGESSLSRQGQPSCCGETNSPAMGVSKSCCIKEGNLKTEVASPVSCCNDPPRIGFLTRLWKESWNATVLVLKFMAWVFFLEAIIVLYIPAHWITTALGTNNAWSILIASLIGVPAYISNLSALPMIAGLLNQGMDPAAALAFLVAGPTTTIPAMSAVWVLTTRKVFVLYVSFAFWGAIFSGYLYALAH